MSLSPPSNLDRRFCIAPMMRYTDRHFRYLLRLISQRAMLYTEMLTARSIVENHAALLTFHAAQHPVAVQLGGSHPADMATAAIIAQDYGYDEININVGCPSARVNAGTFGACLMAHPQQLAKCITTIKNKVTIPVTVKCRIGVDDLDQYENFIDFIQTTTSAGCDTYIVHARKALLNGISPKANRHIPKLKYDYVHRLKRDFPHLNVILNGGLTVESGYSHLLKGLDGVMLGRAVCNQPLILRQVDALYYQAAQVSAPSNSEILQQYMAYMEEQLQLGVPFYPLARHLLNFYKRQSGAKHWRQYLTQQGRKANQPLLELKQFINQFHQENEYVMDSL